MRAKDTAVHDAATYRITNPIITRCASGLSGSVDMAQGGWSMIWGAAPELISPLVVYLCSEQCQETSGLFEVGGGCRDFGFPPTSCTE